MVIMLCLTDICMSKVINCFALMKKVALNRNWFYCERAKQKFAAETRIDVAASHDILFRIIREMTELPWPRAGILPGILSNILLINDRSLCISD